MSESQSEDEMLGVQSEEEQEQSDDSFSDVDEYEENPSAFWETYNSSGEEEEEEQVIDPEDFDFKLMKEKDVEQYLNEDVHELSKEINASASVAKMLLLNQNWDAEKVKKTYEQNASKKLLEDSKIPLVCLVCLGTVSSENSLKGVSCGHNFCEDCWSVYLVMQINSGVATGMECMANDCRIQVPEDFVLDNVKDSSIKKKFAENTRNACVDRHPNLRFCPGPNCKIVVQATVPQAKKVHCKECSTNFCFNCTLEYHAPTPCNFFKKWMRKGADDTETYNYIAAYTKECPECETCIEKNAGCNHVICVKCKFEFCWVCLGDWKKHLVDYYKCNKYQPNPEVEGAAEKAEESLKRYLFYLERYENHGNSLRLEEKISANIKQYMHEKIMSKSGTLIDWKYLIDAGATLMRCRYTLKYTYPTAYYLDDPAKKALFEFQQAQLEKEVERLSRRVEHSRKEDKGTIEHLMAIAEKRRKIMLEYFLA